MTNFESNWDYLNHRPARKNISDKPGRDSFELLKCFSRDQARGKK
jgi:hypothetical protein